MNDRELDQLLRAGDSVPTRDADYWADFPGETARRIRLVGSAEDAESPVRPRRRSALWSALGLLGTAALALLLHRFPGEAERGHPGAFTPMQLEVARRVAAEAMALFPGQLVAVKLEETDHQVVLSDRPNLPASEPLLVRICGAGGGACRSFITFSGRQVEFDGERFEVLAGASGNIVVVGEHSLPRFAASTLGGSL